MTRPIKFRAWDKEIKKIVGIQGICWKNENSEIEDFNIGGLGYGVNYHESPENFILMQYTGLKDKNGKEIYEGDIMFEPFTKSKTVIEWKDYINSMAGFQNLSTWEVIGNIYENKDLLK